MAEIEFQLANAANLDCMVATPAAFGGWNAGGLPVGLVGAGIYLIYNAHNNNRYVGISGNLPQRFQHRYETITEFGFSAAMMQPIILFWGTARTRNTPPAPPMGMAPVLPPWVAVANFTSHAIDGVLVDPEHVLIAFVMRHFHAGTVTNNQKVGTYFSPLANPLSVTLQWGACTGILAGQHQVNWLNNTHL